MMLRKAAALFLLLLAACAQTAPAVSKDAPAGSWSGEYGVPSGQRESISVDLRWDKEILRGTVHAGQRTIPLSKASFNKDTSQLGMEFDAEGNRGQAVHYVIDGKVSGDTITGTWTHDNQQGDFKVTKR